MNFNINLATKVYIDFRRLNIALLLILLVLVTWLSISGYRLYRVYGEIARITEYRERIEKGLGSKKFTDAEYKALQAEVKGINGIIIRKTTDWTALLASFERLLPDGVALKNLESVDKGGVRISASAKTFAGIRRFVENLDNSKLFTDVNLLEHSIVREGGDNKSEFKGFSFSITCMAGAK